MTINIHVQVEEQVIDTVEGDRIYHQLSRLEWPLIGPLNRLVADFACCMLWVNCHAPNPDHLEDVAVGVEDDADTTDEWIVYNARMREYLEGIKDRQRLSLIVQARKQPKRWSGWAGVGIRSLLVRHTYNIFADMVSHDVSEEEGKTLTPESKFMAQYPGEGTTCLMSLDEADPSTGPVWKRPASVLYQVHHVPLTENASYYDAFVAPNVEGGGYVTWINSLRKYQQTYNIKSENIRIVLYVD